MFVTVPVELTALFVFGEMLVVAVAAGVVVAFAVFVPVIVFTLVASTVVIVGLGSLGGLIGNHLG